jgi:hypothetical protein
MAVSRMVIFIVLFILFTVFSILFRTKTASKYEIKSSDIAIGLIPLIIWLLTSGQLTEFGVGDLKLKLKDVYKQTVTSQIDSTLNLSSQTNGSLLIGADCKYSHEDDMASLEKFLQIEPHKYIVIQQNCEDNSRGESDPTFAGLLTVDDYRNIVLAPYTKVGPAYFHDLLKAKNFEQLGQIFPSFVNTKNAIRVNTLKLTALEKMDSLHVEALPVIDDKNHLKTIIEKASLTSSLLIDVGKAVTK